MPKRVGIVAIAVVISIVAACASWAVLTQKLTGAQAGVDVVPWEGPTPAQIALQNAQNELHRQAERRLEYSGCTLWTDRVPVGVDQVVAEWLALFFRRQAPVPADRIAHFRWLENAQDLVDFIGWGAVINGLEQVGDEIWVELRIVPNLESKFPKGGIGAGLTPDHYFETYVVRDGRFNYVGGRPPDVVRHEVRPWMDERVVSFH